MAKMTPGAERPVEPHSFEDCRTIDVTDRLCMRFWSDRLGVPEADIAEVVREVGPNSTAVALKLEAPHTESTVTPSRPAI
jgi:hypothetical protein